MKSLDTSNSGQITKRISSWTQPVPSTPPPKNLLAKSTCNKPLASSIVPSDVMCRGVAPKGALIVSHLGKSFSGILRLVNVTTPVGTFDLSPSVGQTRRK